MKKILALTITMCLMVGFMSFAAFAELPDRIEISFRVGDSVLNINGEPVEVETPFVAGDGVTLVPLRVITEAFGADVEWNGELRQITLTYENVEILLEIENINVYVNDQRQTLLYNPLIVNNVTMVPLRFITENFGADVGWDADTSAITVVKERDGDGAIDIEDVLRRSNMPMAGDSFLGWSISRTPDMELLSRSFDGWRTTFTLSPEARIAVMFFENDENETLTVLQAREMELARNFTFMGQNTRRTTFGNEFLATQYRDADTFFERRWFVRPNDRLALVMIQVDMSIPARERDEFLAVADTFDFNFRASETEDLSDVVNGMRLFDSSDLAFQFRVPADWWEWNREHRVNEFSAGEWVDGGAFATGVSITVVSQQSGDSAQRWANEVLENETRNSNPATFTFTALRTTRIGNVNATYYQSNRRLGGIDFISRRFFWQYQGYMYDLYITVAASNVGMIQRIVDSVRFEAIDPDVLGVVAREPLGIEGVLSTVRNTSLGFSIGIPAAWARLEGNSAFFDNQTGTSVVVLRINDNLSLQDVRNFADSFVREQGSGREMIRVVSQMPNDALSSVLHRGFMFEIKTTPTDTTREAFYSTLYIINVRDNAYLIEIMIPESSYSPSSRELRDDIVRSFVAD